MRQKARPPAPTRRVYLAFAIAALVGLAIFAIWWLTSSRPAGKAEEPPRAAAPQEFTLPRGGTVSVATGRYDEAVARLTQATLVRVNRSTDRVEPWLAESWTSSPDNLVYTFRLRPRILWPDGTPLAAEDVVASLGPIRVGGKPLAARSIDAQTIEVRFAEALAPALRLFDRWPVRPRQTAAHQAGLGPFLRRGASTPETFVRNPHYWRSAPDGSPLPYVDELTLVRGSEPKADVRESPVAAEEYEGLKKLEQSGAVRLFDLGPGLDSDALWFVPVRREGAADKPWLTTELFRRAVSTAIDRRDYCKQVFFEACHPVVTPVSPANAAWFNPDLPLGRGNPQLARTMLAELGLQDRSGDAMLEDAARRPVSFTVLIQRDVPSAVRAASFLVESLRAAGIGVRVEQLDAAALRSRRTKGAYEAIYDRIEFFDTDPALHLDFWLSTGAAHPWSPVRQTPPADWEREIDRLMLKNASSFDRIERLQAFVDVQRIYSQHVPAIFFGVPHIRVYTTTRVVNATPSILRPHVLWNAENLVVLKK